MSARPTEERSVHTRLLKCALEVEESRAYWRHAAPGVEVSSQAVFEAWWFGAKSLDRVQVLLANFRARFDAFPQALQVLHRWRDMSPATRSLVCHWHLQLSDPLYRSFTGDYLVQRRAGPRPEVTRDLVVTWVGDQGPGRWTMPTRIQFASKLLSAAAAAGLVASTRDPRPLVLPRVDDLALGYLVHLLREVSFEGSLLENPYLRSVGLEGALLADRLRALPGLGFRRQANLLDLTWESPDLPAWARVNGLLGDEP